ncbi:unnamed protein product [Pseudo-nitzschia multistriata]|uniref:HTH psq-type domain-containing protein n=1 Tax=Pseudo-nitzschia multistriata TaxID=183589 RepID=A0A448YUB6_9STRA|nr:unnamed protein product [Pseudo-nitzschia multistriata]
MDDPHGQDLLEVDGLSHAGDDAEPTPLSDLHAHDLNLSVGGNGPVAGGVGVGVAVGVGVEVPVGVSATGADPYGGESTADRDDLLHAHDGLPLAPDPAHERRNRDLLERLHRQYHGHHPYGGHGRSRSDSFGVEEGGGGGNDDDGNDGNDDDSDGIAEATVLALRQEAAENAGGIAGHHPAELGDPIVDQLRHDPHGALALDRGPPPPPVDDPPAGPRLPMHGAAVFVPALQPQKQSLCRSVDGDGSNSRSGNHAPQTRQSPGETGGGGLKRRRTGSPCTRGDATATGGTPKPVRRRRRYNNDFKAEVLGHLGETRGTVSGAARRYGLPENTVREWTRSGVAGAIDRARAATTEGGGLKANVRKDPMRKLKEELVGFFEYNKGLPEEHRQRVSTKLVAAKGLEVRNNLLRIHETNPLFLDEKELKALEAFRGSDSWAKKFAKRQNLRMTGARVRGLSEEDVAGYHRSLKQISVRVGQAGPGFEEAAALIQRAAEKLLCASIVHSAKASGAGPRGGQGSTAGRSQRQQLRPPVRGGASACPGPPGLSPPDGAGTGVLGVALDPTGPVPGQGQNHCVSPTTTPPPPMAETPTMLSGA